jgi:hypothetical protein
MDRGGLVLDSRVWTYCQRRGDLKFRPQLVRRQRLLDLDLGQGHQRVHGVCHSGFRTTRYGPGHSPGSRSI